MFNSNIDDFKKESLTILKKFYDLEFSLTSNFDLLDSSTTNQIAKINNTYVIKKINREINNSITTWYEKVNEVLICNCFSDIYIKNKLNLIITVDNKKTWILMKNIQGEHFYFKSKKSLCEVSEFIEKLSSIQLIDNKLELSEDITFFMHKSEIMKIYTNISYYVNEFNRTIQPLLSLINIENNEISRTLNFIAENINLDDEKSFTKCLSHGEIQGQNLIFKDESLVGVVDWGSLSIRYKIFDVAMSACFLCRKQRGSFEIDTDLYKFYIDTFNLNYHEKMNLKYAMLICFLPDSRTLCEYLEYSTEKALWYINWCNSALKNLLEFITKEMD